MKSILKGVRTSSKVFLSGYLILVPYFLIAQVIHVPGPDSLTIQQGINAANDGDTVLVADDIYHENINFMGKAIMVASHYIEDGDTNHINNTVINGSQAVDRDQGSTVFFISGEDTTSILAGFTITGGSGWIEPTYGARIGGGIVCYNSSAKIIHNKIITNSVQSSDYAWGGGIAAINMTIDEWIVLKNNIILDNSTQAENIAATGGGAEIWGNARINNNIIECNNCYCESGQSGGGGLVVDSPENESALAIIYDNIVRNNSIESGLNGYGAGLYIRYTNCIIRENEITENHLTSGGGNGAGLYARETASLELTNNQISYNNMILNIHDNWYGAGMYFEQPAGPSWILNNIISYNTGTPEGWGRGGGISMHNAWDQSVLIDGNFFSSNHCFRGGGFYEQNCHNISFTNNIFSNNSATSGSSGRGGAIALYNPTLSGDSHFNRVDEIKTLIVNNTFYSNTADYQGGAVHFNGAISPPAIMNCIFWQNEAPTGKDINNITAETVHVFYSNIDTLSINGFWAGTDNIFSDPQFRDDSCHIGGSSHCIEMGIDSLEIDGTWYYAPDHDFDGNIRPDPICRGVDMGADEVDCVGIEEETEADSSQFAVRCYPNPVSGSVQFAVRSSQDGLVTLKIYDLHGREMATVLEQKLPAGEHTVQWHCDNLPSGVYFYILRTADCELRTANCRSPVSGKILVNH